MSPRDGLQVVNRSGEIAREDRAALIDDLRRARLPYIEAGAFVSARRVPAMGDTGELLARCAAARPAGGEEPPRGASAGGSQLGVLIPNLQYYNMFRASGGHADTVAVFVSASEAYSVKNTRMTGKEALDAAVAVVRAARADGYAVRAHVSGAFRDLTEKNRPSREEDVLAVCAPLRAENASMVIALADTDGRAGEVDIARVVGHLKNALGIDHLGVHLHDRGGSALRCARVAFDAGIRVFDGAVGGVGGNPTALADPVGNVATEGLVALFESLGAETGVDRDALFDAGERIARMTQLVGDPPPPSVLLREELERRRASQ